MLTKIFRFLFCRSRTCKDIDECATNNGKGDCEYACANTDGSFRCSCPAGYSIGDDGLTCYDIDECQVQNGQCSQKCENKPGSHKCDCFDGFVNLGNNLTDVICIDIGKAFKSNIKLPFFFSQISFEGLMRISSASLTCVFRSFKDPCF